MGRKMKESLSEPILFYESTFYMLSNFSAFTVEHDGELWPTAEHAYQASKFYFHQGEIRDQIRSARSPHEAKRIAHAFDNEKRDTWEKEKISVMVQILWAKFHQHPYIQEVLLKTGEREIIENSHEDAFWGWGPDKNGQNYLGRIWTHIRSSFRKGQQAHFEEFFGDTPFRA